MGWKVCTRVRLEEDVGMVQLVADLYRRQILRRLLLRTRAISRVNDKGMSDGWMLMHAIYQQKLTSIPKN